MVVVEIPKHAQIEDGDPEDIRFIDGHDIDFLDSTFFAEAGSWEWYPTDEAWDLDNYGA